LNILNKNLMRVSDLQDEDDEKYVLSLSIINFLKASTHAPIMHRHMRGKAHVLKQILMNEDLYSSIRLKSTPIDIENSFIGRDINCLLETVSGVQSINPYCDVSLRVIMRIADLLQARHFC